MHRLMVMTMFLNGHSRLTESDVSKKKKKGFAERFYF